MISSAVRKSFSSMKLLLKIHHRPSRAYKNKTSFIVVRAGNQMWPIVVFEVATECTEVKFTCTACDTCEMEKSQNLRKT